MPDDFNTALSKSANMFKTLCVPLLTPLLPDTEFISIEEHTSSYSQKILDMLAGIDVWVIHKNPSGVRGLASRIQYGKNWQTFTVRKQRESGASTEYEKRKHAMSNDYIYPYFTLQAYIKDDEIEGMAICFTHALYKIIEQGLCETRKTGDSQIGQAIFYVVHWDTFEPDDIRIYVKNQGWTQNNKHQEAA